MEANLSACELAHSATMTIPLLGVVAAGQPYQAFAVEETLSVPSALWGGKRVFALHVRGRRELQYAAVQVGDELEERVSVDNPTSLPVIWALNGTSGRGSMPASWSVPADEVPSIAARLIP